MVRFEEPVVDKSGFREVERTETAETPKWPGYARTVGEKGLGMNGPLGGSAITQTCHCTTEGGRRIVIKEEEASTEMLKPGSAIEGLPLSE